MKLSPECVFISLLDSVSNFLVLFHFKMGKEVGVRKGTQVLSSLPQPQILVLYALVSVLHSLISIWLLKVGFGGFFWWWFFFFLFSTGNLTKGPSPKK